MDRIKELEKLIEEWKADANFAKVASNPQRESYCNGGVEALESALKRIKQPSNRCNHLKQLCNVCLSQKCAWHGTEWPVIT